ncbi:MAG: GNAT family protein [Parcubacteria group bacterium]
MLKGSHVILRPIRKEDLQLFLKWFNDQEVIRYLNFYLPVMESMEEKWIEDLAKPDSDRVVFMIEAKTGENEFKPIGTCGLHGIDHHDQNATLGIALGEKNLHRKGYGSEAGRLIVDYGFKELNLHRIGSFAFEENAPSIGLHRKLGFKQEGIVRECKFKGGKFHNLVAFSLLRGEQK